MDWYGDQQNQLLIQKASDYCDGLISFQDLKEFAVLNVLNYLDSENPAIDKLICEIEGSVVEIDEDLLTEEEFKDNLQNLIKNAEQTLACQTKSSASLDCTIATWEPENLPPSLTTYAEALVR